MAFSMDWEFEEIEVIRDGLTAYGTAEIEAEDGEMVITGVKIGDIVFTRTGHGPLGSTFGRVLFENITKKLEQDERLQSRFRERYDDYCQGDPDRMHDSRRDDYAMWRVA